MSIPEEGSIAIEDGWSRSISDSLCCGKTTSSSATGCKLDGGIGGGAGGLSRSFFSMTGKGGTTGTICGIAALAGFGFKIGLNTLGCDMAGAAGGCGGKDELEDDVDGGSKGGGCFGCGIPNPGGKEGVVGI